MAKVRPWLASGMRRCSNVVFKVALGHNTRPVFFDIDRIRPELRELEAHVDVIRAELAPFLADRSEIPRYHEIDPRQREISSGERDWRVLLLHGLAPSSSRRRREPFARTWEILDRIPGLFGAFFSILEPGKSIPPHAGPYLGYLRYHLALQVPDANPPSLRVKDLDYTWRAGEGILFDDSYRHLVTNEADEVRVVLVVDVMRPMRWPLSALNRCTARLLARGQ